MCAGALTLPEPRRKLLDIDRSVSFRFCWQSVTSTQGGTGVTHIKRENMKTSFSRNNSSLAVACALALGHVFIEIRGQRLKQ